ncbi:hypothetical protein UPYG_G00232430 [Umbra pygmaea]|uniref:DUF4549 domain-containing protein n=1 Tax=Umbra pygmaea TaxID=75934 RepID=A0ABD0WDR3_UMBPY
MSMVVYKVSSTAKIVQLEAELSAQLSALRTKIEENESPLETPSRASSSVPVPKDVLYFRAEREHVLRGGLQVADALPFVSPCEVGQRELESCLGLEYTPESLPLLLHQFYSDRCYQLAQIKYQLMLRWIRFCRHSHIIDQLYPAYKTQVSYLVSEYEDAVQRAKRLAVSREKILTGRGNPINYVTQDDVKIYLTWLVCHLHAVKPIHHFLRVVHYIPASEWIDKDLLAKVPPSSPKLVESISTSDRTTEDMMAGLEGRDTFLGHRVKLEDFLPELHNLVSYFGLPYNTHNIRNTADEMELFSEVWREFRVRFRQQEEMKTFLQYDGTEAIEGQWGKKSGSMALRKNANWIPHIQVKPKQNPWQQKLVTKLKELQSYDDLLRAHCSFLQLSDPVVVTEALKEHAVHFCDHKVIQTSPSVIFSNTSGHDTSQIWASIYHAANLSQGSQGHGRQHKSNTKSQTPLVDKRSERYSYLRSLQLLGLDEGQEGEDGLSDPIITMGAYLSLLHLRYLKTRDLQRICLGMLNYLRSIERTLTFDTAGMRVEKEGEKAGGAGGMVSSAEETTWMSAARGGCGTVEGLGSHLYSHNTPVDNKVHCSECMEFPEVENLHDFYTKVERYYHTQDQRGLYVVYDVALKDLEELEDSLTLLGSYFIQRRSSKGAEGRAKMQSESQSSASTDLQSSSWPQTDMDRGAVLLELWTWEAAFLESKVQLLNCYMEAYHHVSGPEERFSMAQVITDIMHRRPRLDLDMGAECLVQTYRAEMVCLQTHQQLIRAVLNSQIEHQRLYLQRVWRGDQGVGASSQTYGLPIYYVAKHLVSLGDSSRPALMNVFLLEVHPSLSLASDVYQALSRAHTQLCQLHCARRVAETVTLEQKLLQQALQHWHSLIPPGAFYSCQTQRDLFSDVFMEEPSLVRAVGMSLVRSAEEQDMKQGKDKQLFAVETFSKLLELVTIRHRLIESAAETAHLAQIYKTQAMQLGFDEFHLYVRPVHFEFAVLRDDTEQRPPLLEDDSWMDRYIPSSLPLSIHELDENHIGKFSFSSADAVVQLMSSSAIENLQVVLACQVTQKNALIGAVKQACLCYWSKKDDLSSTSLMKQGQVCKHASEQKATGPGNKRSLAEAFVSIQLEKVGPRDEMLNSFVKRKQTMGVAITNPEEVEKVKRRLILEFCQKFCVRMATYCVRAQIVGLYHSLTALLEELPDIRQSHFLIGHAHELKGDVDSELRLDPRKFQRRPRRLLSADGKTFLNLWFLPHYTEVLLMFRTLEDSECNQALHHTLEIVSGLHDIVYYLVTFARLGNPGFFSSRRKGAGRKELTADWGGSEGIGEELWQLQRQVDSLCDPASPEAVARLLQLRRHVIFLQYDTAVRYLIGEAFLSSGNVAAYQSVSDNMGHALPVLSDSLLNNHSSLLTLPQPVEPRSTLAQTMYPWRSFLVCHGLQPLNILDNSPIEYCLQLCLSGLGERSRMEANGAILAVSLLMEDVLNSGGAEVAPIRLHEKENSLEMPAKEDGSRMDDGYEQRNEEKKPSVPRALDPLQGLSVLKGFLLLTKQLEVFKDSWGRRQLGVEQINTVKMYRQFSSLYRKEIHYPSMRALAQQMGKEMEFEALLSDNQPLLPPAGASEVDIKTCQLLRLLESTECDMIRAVQRRITRELTLVTSERACQDTGLPTELWKRGPMRHCLSLERPQIVENFTQTLMQGAEETEEQLTLPKAHLQRCLSSLGCSVMERERSNFLLYSHFYEQILEQKRRLLYQREQDVRSLEESRSKVINPYGEVSGICRGMAMQNTALRIQIAHLEEEQQGLQQQISLQYKQRYDSLVRQLFTTCIQLKAKLDEYQVRMECDFKELVSKVRREGADKMIKLKKKFSSTKDNDTFFTTQSKKQELHDLSMENSQLTGLLCKMKVLGHWKKVVGQGKLHRKLLNSQQREMSCQREATRTKMMSEEEVFLLKQELEVSQMALAQCQMEYNGIKSLLTKQSTELHEVKLRYAQEFQSRQELETNHVKSLQQLREDLEERDKQLRDIHAQLDRSHQDRHLLRQRSAKDIRQVKGQLHQERSLKQEAFQWVGRLQSQADNNDSSMSRCTSTPGRSKPSCYTFPQKRSSIRCLEHAGSTQQEDSKRDYTTQLERPKTDPSRLRVFTAETLLPDLTVGGLNSTILLTHLQRPGL